MRFGCWVLVCATTLVAGGCGEASAHAPTGDGELIIELGGDHEPLALALERWGQKTAPMPPPERDGDPESDRDSAARDNPESDPAPRDEGRQPGPPSERPGEDPVPQFATVILREGQTLYGLAREHLGDGGRWPDILRWNGWSEAEASALPAGTRVRIQRSGSR